MVAEAVRKLAEFEKRPARAVLEHLLLPPADLLHFREVSPDAEAGNLPLDHAVRMVSGARRLNLPRQARVRTGPRGVPAIVDGCRIEARRESWLVEDRWWTERPLRRRYWELVSDEGRDIVVFHDLLDGRWYTQR